MCFHPLHLKPQHYGPKEFPPWFRFEVQKLKWYYLDITFPSNLNGAYW